MSRIYAILKKNIKLLLRSRSSALIIILGPLLIILLVGVAFNTTGQGAIEIGVYSQKYSDLSNSFVTALKDQAFNVVKFDSKDLCTDSIKSGTIHACVVFPPDLKVRNDKQSDIELYIDYTRVNLAYSIQDAITSKVDVRTTQISKDLTQVLINKLEETKNEMTASTPLMISLSSQNSQANDTGSRMLSIISGTDLSFNVADYKTTDLEKSTSSIKTLLANTTNVSSKRVKDISAEIESMKSELSSLKSGNISNEKRQKIDELSESLSSLQSSLENYSAFISSNLVKTRESAFGLDKEISGMVSSVNSNLAEVRTKFDKAKKANLDVSAQIAALEKVLKDNKDALEKMQQSRQKITSNIQSTEVTNVNTIINPINIKRHNITTEKTNLNLLLPGLIIMVIMFISILISSTIVVTEKTSKAHFRNFMSPTTDIMFLFGNFLSSMFIVLIQSVVIVGISSIFFGVSIGQSFFSIISIILLAIVLFILIGTLVGLIFNSEETSTLAAISVSSIMLFLSGFIIPLESMPSSMMAAARYNPFLMLSDMLKKSMIFHSPISEALSGFWTIIAVIVLLCAACYATSKLMHKHFLHRYSSHFFKR